MNIMVFDVPAESGGALSVLNDFYNEYKANKKNNYIFVVSKPELEETENIKIMRFPWVKKSWLHRLYFDNFIANKLVKEYKTDEVLSLQNIIIPHTDIYQTVYIHNSLPFVNYRFSITENTLLWIYQNILSRIIYNSIIKANKVIVQTEWMKKECVRKLKVSESKIEVIPPKINIVVKKYFESTHDSLTTFFYPASGVAFKNHKLIIETCLKFQIEGIKEYKVVLTLDGNENKNILRLFEIAKENNLPIAFIGNISREQVFDYYSKSTLIFPSYIETVGLPLIEAKIHKTPILASDCPYSHEILDGYEQVNFFDPFSIESLYKKLSLLVSNQGV
jgi:glycosyltransferase involved in cell wall biosynthesis